MTVRPIRKSSNSSAAASVKVSGIRSPLSIQAERHIQCPVHGGIPVTAAEGGVIDHPLFQRLRNIRQLGNAHHVFPSATHTRFSHSIGVMHQASALFQAILRRHIDHQPPDEKTARALASTHARVRLAALCHDLGHGPFSHHFEHVLEEAGVCYGDWQAESLRLPLAWVDPAARSAWLAEPLCHEHISFGAVLNLQLADEDARAICSLLDARVTPGGSFRDDLITLASAFGGRAEDAASLLSCLRGLLSSDLDADRMDYLQRDALFCGVAVSLDSDHLLNSIQLAHTGERFVIRLQRNAVFAVEQILLARKQMFDQVYMNRVTQLMDDLLGMGMRELMRLGRLRVPCDAAGLLRLTEAAVLEWLAALVTNCSVRDEPALRGDLAVKMYLTRCVPVTLDTRFTEAHLVDQVRQDLARAHPEGHVVCQPQKELIKGSSRDLNRKETAVLFTEMSPGAPLVPVQQVSELIRSTAWRNPQVRVLVTRSLFDSAVQRGLERKLQAMGYTQTGATTRTPAGKRAAERRPAPKGRATRSPRR